MLIAGNNCPIKVHTYCKMCQRSFPSVWMSDETWKLSFGKFLEMFLYNRSAVSRHPQCGHAIRDHHTICFTCEGLIARFDFIPVHPYSLHIRYHLPHPVEELNCELFRRMFLFSLQGNFILDEFVRAVTMTEIEAKECVASAGKTTIVDGLTDALQLLESVKADVLALTISLNEEIDFFQKLLGVQDQLGARGSSSQRLSTGAASMVSIAEIFGADISTADIDANRFLQLLPEGRLSHVASTLTYKEIVATYPLLQRHEVFRSAVSWNASIERVQAAVEAQRLAQWEAAELERQRANNEFKELKTIEEENESALDSSGHSAVHSPAGNASPPRKASFGGSLSSSEHGKDRSDGGTVVYTNSPAPSSENGTLDGSQHGDHPGPLSTNYLPSVSTNTVPSSMALTSVPTMTSTNANTTSTSSRITKTLAKYLLGKDNQPGSVETAKHTVNISTYFPGHYHLPAGRNGEVIQVQEEALSTIIAYSLSSDEYYKKFNEYISMDASAGGGQAGNASNTSFVRSTTLTTPSGARSSATNQRSAIADSATVNNVEGKVAFAGLDDVPIDKGSPEHGAGPANLPNFMGALSSGFFSDDEDSDDEVDPVPAASNASQSIATESKGSGTVAKEKSVSEPAASSTNPLTMMTASLPWRRNRRRIFVPVSSSNTAASISITSIKEDEETDHAAKELAFDDDAASDASGAEDHAAAEAHVGRPTILQGDVGHVLSASGSLSRPENGDGGFIADGSTRSSEDFDNDPMRPAPSVEALSTEERKRLNEKQLLSQRQSHIKHRFEEVDEKQNVLCKFICQTFWATQFEALRTAYFEGIDERSDTERSHWDARMHERHLHEGFVRSLSMSANWNATGGKSGAAFSKTVDDR